MTSLPLLVTLCSYFLFSSEISVAVDTIGKNQSLTDNQTLISSGQTFELGFFSIFNTKNRYLGITYKISGTIIWVANRNNPVTDSSGVFTISKDGNIIVLNGSNYVLWSTNISKTVQNPVVQLLESGNLVLKDGILNDSRNYLWESFDYPSDTLLPGMKLGWDLKTGLNRNLKSWKHIDDPSIGDYSYGFDLTELLPELVIRNGLIKEFRTGVWNGTRFRTFPSSKSNPFLETTFISNTEVYFSYEHNKTNSSITRLQLDPWGKLRYFKWDNQALNWTTLLEIPKDQCDNYNKCGTNGLCNINKSQPCDCLKGFVPKSQQKDVIDWRVGCSRRTLLECENGDKFESIERVKLPDMMKFSINKSMGLDECKMECSRNCSCTAYANSNISENGNGGCILWFGELLDIRQLTDESWQVLYIRLAASEKGPTNNTRKKKSKVGRILGLSVGSTLFLFCLVICYIIWRKRTKGAAAAAAGISEESREEDLELPLFDLTTVETATNNFSQANEIGKGGFGPVYKGKLAEGQEVAVKRLSKDSGQGVTEFKNEVIMIAKLQHRNLVKLLGCCIHGEERILIYEYMPNKSLDYFIFDEKKSKLLDWQKRSSIIAGIARGLLYLHQDSRLRIIHRDLKASNILLDFNMNPKISDFGLARIFRGDQTEAETKRVVGTYGYMPPEYAIDGNFSMKSDVFSFGVLLLEIVSGKRNRGFFHEDHHHNLIGHAWILWIENKALEITDPCLEDSSFISSEVLRCIQVGLLCVQQMPEDRPSMLSVVIMMGTADSILPEPKQPGFFIERNWFDTSADGSSENHVTISALEAR